MAAIYWDELETILMDYITAGWAADLYADVPLFFENGPETAEEVESNNYVVVNIQGVTSEKTVFGGPGMRMSQEWGIVFYHAFVPIESGKSDATRMCVTIQKILELKNIGNGIIFIGADPPSPALRTNDDLIPVSQPGGDEYRVSGSCAFSVIGSR